jgi:hypothetical protein
MISHDFQRSVAIAIVFSLWSAFQCFSEPEFSPGILQNKHLLVKIDLGVDDSLFGTVVSYIDKSLPDSSAVHGWFGLRAGSQGPSGKRVIKALRDTVAVEVSGFGARNLTAQITYFLKDNSLQVESRIITNSPTEFTDGLWFNFPLSYPAISIITPNLTSKPLNLFLPDMNFSDLNPMVRFSDRQHAITVLTRNPFHAFWKFDNFSRKNHRIDILKHWTPANNWNLDFGAQPQIASTLGAGDTIFRHFEIFNTEPIGNLFFWGEHKDGWSQSLTMYWDELPLAPLSNLWGFMTSSRADSAQVDNCFIKMFEAHPRAKMGYLLIPDRILYRENAAFKGWYVGGPYCIPDSLEKRTGKWCLNIVDIDSGSQQIGQKVRCRPATSYTLSYWMKTEGVDPSGIGASGYFRTPDWQTFACGDNITGTNDWQRYEISLTTGPNDTVLLIALGIVKAKGSAWFDDVMLIDSANNNPLQNGGFEENVPKFVFENKRRLWVDAHGPNHIVSAPPAFRKFLRDIENGTLTHGWEDRIRLGCHGYHHTPTLNKPDSPSPGWEFQCFDSIGDHLRIEKIFSDMQAAGLTRKSMRYWRSPGFQYTRSLVNLLVDSGFVFMDPGITALSGNTRCFFIERLGKRMWLPEQTFWADSESNTSPSKTTEYLRQGHLAHFGGHPVAMFKPRNKFYYNKFDNFLTTLEKTFPNLGYVFPDEYADNANAVYDLRIGNTTQSGKFISIEILGKTLQGNTLVMQGNCSEAMWNCKTSLPVKIEGDLSYIILPKSRENRNTLVLKVQTIQNDQPPLQPPPLLKIATAETLFPTTLFDMAGRSLATFPSKTPELTGNGKMNTLVKLLPKGVYLYCVTNKEKRILTQVIRNF